MDFAKSALTLIQRLRSPPDSMSARFVGVFFALAAALDAYFILDIFMSYITAIRSLAALGRGRRIAHNA